MLAEAVHVARRAPWLSASTRMTEVAMLPWARRAPSSGPPPASHYPAPPLQHIYGHLCACVIILKLIKNAQKSKSTKILLKANSTNFNKMQLKRIEIVQLYSTHPLYIRIKSCNIFVDVYPALWSHGYKQYSNKSGLTNVGLRTEPLAISSFNTTDIIHRNTPHQKINK